MIHEQMLAEIVEKVNKEINLFGEQQQKGMGNVILLVGKTGSGKSTIFNFLIGAEFIMEQDVLALQSKEEQFSEMMEGVHSVTKVPKCYFQEQCQHLIVDFPGFSDTNGSQNEILFQSLFNKITWKSNLKIVYVSSQSRNQLENRGSDLQSFLKSFLCQENNIQLDNITLLMNNYCQKMEEQKLRKKWQEEIKDALKLDQYQGKIIIQRQISDADEIQEYLSSKQREKIWQELIQTPVVKLQPHQFTDRDIISSYLIESINLILFETFHELDSKLSALALTIEQLDKVIQQYTYIQGILYNATILNLINWIDEYLSIMKGIRTILTFQSKLKYDEKVFKVIYQFFLDYKDQIYGYHQVGQTICKVTNNFNVISQNLNQKKVQLITVQESIKAKLQAEERQRAMAAESERLVKEKQRLEKEMERQWQERERERDRQERQRDRQEREKQDKERQDRERLEREKQDKERQDRERQERVKEKQERESKERQRQQSEWLEKLSPQEKKRQEQKIEADNKIRQYQADMEYYRRNQSSGGGCSIF